MKRGEIWTASGGTDYAGKPRPWLIVQSDLFPVEASVILCGFTSVVDDSEILRPLIEPDQGNGLRAPSRVMIDKVSAVARTKLRDRIGVLSDEHMSRVERALALILGFAD